METPSNTFKMKFDEVQGIKLPCTLLSVKLKIDPTDSNHIMDVLNHSLEIHNASFQKVIKNEQS